MCKSNSILLNAAILVVLISSAHIAMAKYSGGTGVIGDPYQINSDIDLLALSADSINFDKAFVLTADINLSSYIFTTSIIGYDFNNTDIYYDGVPFTGIFDGNGFKISNLTIDSNGQGNDFLGLFAYALNSEIKNLILEKITIKDGNDSSWIGSIAGCNQGDINNCVASGSISVGAESFLIGGLAGSNNSGNILNSTSSVYVKTKFYNTNVGGITGYSDSNILNCFAKSVIMAGGYSTDVGGITGFNDGNIFSCRFYGTILSFTSSAQIGGISGFNDGIITNCLSGGQVTGFLRTSQIGGIAGANIGGTIISSTSQSIVSGANTLGGLVGYDEFSLISNCYSKGKIYSFLGLTDAYGLGGFAGITTDSTITNCYSSGLVASKNIMSYTGGMMGLSQSQLTNCYFLKTCGPNNGCAAPLTDIQMKTMASFAGWDFAGETVNGTSDIWTITQSTGYPVLTWQFSIPKVQSLRNTRHHRIR